MQIVIDIQDGVYKTLIEDRYPIPNAELLAVLFKMLVKKSVPLPKGHGRLVDADAILEDPYGNTYKDIDIAETIIEADKEADL